MTTHDSDIRAAILDYARAAMDRSDLNSPPPESNLPFDDPGFDAALASSEPELFEILGRWHAGSFRGLLSDAAARGRVGDETKHGPATAAATFFLVPIQGPQLLLGRHLTFVNEYGAVGKAVGRFWSSPAGDVQVLLPVVMPIEALERASPRAIRLALDAARRSPLPEPGQGLDGTVVEAVRRMLKAETSGALEERSTARGQPWELVNRPAMRAILGIRFLVSDAEAPWTIPPDMLAPTATTPSETAWRAWADERYAHVQIEMDPPQSWSSGCATAAARHAMLLINQRWRTHYNMTVVDVIRGGGIAVAGAGEKLAVTIRCNGTIGPVETPAALVQMDPARFRAELYRLSGAWSLESTGVNLVGK